MSDQYKILVVYYTRSGTTRRIAEMLALELGADIEPVRETARHAARKGVRGYLRSLVDILWHRPVDVMPPIHRLQDYDAVVVGSPVWAGFASAPVEAWLKHNGACVQHIAFFCTLRKRGSDSAFDQMGEASGKFAIATCAFDAPDLRRGYDGTLREKFEAQICRRLDTLLAMECAA